MLDTVAAGPALGQAQLEVVGDTHEEDIVRLGRLGQNLLETVSLIRSETATDTELKLAAAA